MSNGEVQPQSEKTLRSSKIRLEISRTVQTARFESIVITHGIEEEIKWETLEDRQKKLANWETVLLETYKKTYDNVLDELKLAHKKAFFKEPAEKNHGPSERDLEDLDELP